MKRQLLRIIAAVLIVTGACSIAPVAFTGCQQFPTVSQQNTDQIILRAEQAAQTARATFTLFVHLERDNEALLKTVNPQIHIYANTIRRNGLNWVTALRNATDTFEANRTADNQAYLGTWLATVNNALDQVNKYMATAKGALPQ